MERNQAMLLRMYGALGAARAAVNAAAAHTQTLASDDAIELETRIETINEELRKLCRDVAHRAGI